jgi:hypothetical protein
MQQAYNRTSAQASQQNVQLPKHMQTIKHTTRASAAAPKHAQQHMQKFKHSKTCMQQAHADNNPDNQRLAQSPS